MSTIIAIILTMVTISLHFLITGLTLIIFGLIMIAPWILLYMLFEWIFE